MKHDKRILPIILVIFVCLLSCIFTGQLFYKRCLWWNCAPARTFDVMDLGLPSTLFSDTAQTSQIHYDSDDNLETISSGAQTIYSENGNGFGIYLIDRYATFKNAKKEYNRTKNWFFKNGNTKIPWNEHVLIYKSSFADEFYSACGIIVAKDYRCGMAAQYQEFFVFFNATITEEITLDDFQRVVIFIDKQMAKHLYEK